MNILLVDDEERSRQYLAQFLREHGHLVMEAGEGLAALEMIKATRPDLVLCDNKMPGMFGVDLFKEVRALNLEPSPHLVLFTAYSDENTLLHALKSGAEDYLIKPLAIEDVLMVIDRFNQQPEEPVFSLEKPQDKKNPTQPIASANEICIASRSMQEIYNLARLLHMDPSIPVLIEGETGTGKEVLARFIHNGDEGSQAPFVALNCAALSPTVFESELFGYEAGSFTGALVKGQKGKLDIAQGGTLFLDEISEIPIKLQAKLLRLIEEKSFFRVGGLVELSTTARILCSSNRNLDSMISRGLFRQDLFYRLNVAHINIPPLRERREEILPLANLFLQTFSAKRNKAFFSIDRSAAKVLHDYNWPGNIRELKNLIERVVLIHDDTSLKPCHLDIPFPLMITDPKPAVSRSVQATSLTSAFPFGLPPARLPLDPFIDEIILRALEQHGGNKTEAARYLDVSRSVLYHRLNKMK